ncbi:MAG: TonB-dependent receptor [Spirochaetales bacterium]|nr:TonB-dependent receptor [Spirochaetales bacterium]
MIVVTGSKFEQNADDSIEKVEVISEEEIREKGAKTLLEALAQIPGIQASDHGTSSIMLQGFDGDYVKILIDGIEVNGRINGAVPSGLIPVSSIERIEIIRGASSALYGSDAMGGVINIITKKQIKDTTEFSGELVQEAATNLRTYTESSLSYSTGKMNLGLSGSFDYDSGNLQSESQDEKYYDVYKIPLSRLGSIRGTADWILENGRIGVFSSYSNFYNKSNSGTVYRTSYDTHKADAGLTWESTPGDLLSMSGFISGKYFDLELGSYDLTDNSASIENRVFTDLEAEVRADYSPWINHSFLFGSNLKFETLEDDASFDEIKMGMQMSLFAQDNWDITSDERFILTPGFRIDYSPPLDKDSSPLFQLTPKLSFKWAMESGILRASYGMGYKMPTMQQKYWVFWHNYGGTGFYVLGNPDLKPEKSHGLNLSYTRKIHSKWNISCGLYFNAVRDLINTQMDSGDGDYTYQNVDKAVTYGGDARIQYAGSNYRGSLSYAYTAAKAYNESLGRYIDLEDRVPHSLQLTSSYTFTSIDLKIHGSGTWESPRVQNGVTEYMSPDKFLISLGIDKSFGEHFELYIKGENLLDNLHFIRGSGGSYEGVSQEDYFEYYDGIIVTIGGRLKL